MTRKNIWWGRDWTRIMDILTALGVILVGATGILAFGALSYGVGWLALEYGGPLLEGCQNYGGDVIPCGVEDYIEAGFMGLAVLGIMVGLVAWVWPRRVEKR